MGILRLRAICSWCHISLLKINIAAVERRRQGGTERQQACCVEFKDLFGHFKEGMAWIRETSILA